MTAHIIQKKLSYQIVGTLFDVYNLLGPGYQEKYYQRAISVAFKKQNLPFKEQIAMPLKFGEDVIGKYFLDFIVEDSIALEIKSQRYFHKRDIKQVLGYLRAYDLPLGILACFSTSGLLFKRILKGK